jgi:hypothetical protein
VSRPRVPRVAAGCSIVAAKPLTGQQARRCDFSAVRTWADAN